MVYILVPMLVVLMVGIVVLWRIHYFFRDPERRTPEGRNVISPADGTIVYIRKIEHGLAPIAIKEKRQIRLTEVTKGKVTVESGYIIGIYMTLWDVHVNRSPISGVVEEVSYHPVTKNRSMALFGFQMVLRGKSSPGSMKHVLENERNTIRISGDLVVYLVQIADFYTNRIICWVKNGQLVTKGERIGQIRMGSQVDLILPDSSNLNILIKEGRKVIAGETVIATY